MEDYKKKYEKAMLRMNKWVEGSEITEPKEVAEFVFPELKESEDERIRKTFYEYFKERKDDGDVDETWYGISYDKILAWLERQCERANFRNKIQIGDEVTRNEDGALVNISQFKRMVKQREQKPIEWNSDDLLKRNQIMDILQEYNRTELMAWLEKQGEQSIYEVPSRNIILAVWELGNEWKELTNGSISKEYGTQLEYIQKHWNKSEYYLRDKQGEQKLFNNDKYQTVSVKILDRLYEFEKELERLKQVEQKPAWSEEDEIGLDNTMWAIEQARTIAKDENDMGNLWYAENWLKSIKERMKGE